MASSDVAPLRYVGLTTRAIAFALDAALINFVAIVVGVGVALIVSLMHLPRELKGILLAVGGFAYVAWTVGYFVGFWATAGQTPGGRVMRFRVLAAGGGRVKPRRALLRCIGLVLAALPLFAGYLLILFDPLRRGLQDRIARTVVVEAPALSIAQQRRRQRQASAPAGKSSNSGDDRQPLLTQP